MGMVDYPYLIRSIRHGLEGWKEVCCPLRAEGLTYQVQAAVPDMGKVPRQIVTASTLHPLISPTRDQSVGTVASAANKPL